MATSQSDLIIDAMVTRLADIAVARTHQGGHNYLTTPVTVARGTKFPQEVDPDKRPALYVAVLEPTRRKSLPGGMLRKETRFVIHGYVRTFNRTDEQKRNESHDLRHDVEKAIMEDPRLGATCTQCLPRDDDSSDTRPAEAAVDGWISMTADVLWFEARNEA